MGKISEAFEKIGKTGDDRRATESLNKEKAANEAPAARPVESIIENKKRFDNARLDSNLISLFHPSSFEAEQFKLLRTQLLFPLNDHAHRSLMITSAVPGEGKSFVAANLAITIAQSINKHVLLMDCDLRKPSLNRMFGFGRVPGLSEYLNKNQDLQTLLLKTPIEKLTLLPAGSSPPNPAELLSSEKMIHLIQEVKERYNDRYIIIDSPPPHLTAESNAIAKLVDGVVLVIRHRATNRELVVDLIKRLGKDNFLGVVFNQIDLADLQVYGRYKYGKYDKYYRKG